MRVAANGIPLLGLQTGVSRYMRCLYEAMGALSEASVSYLTFSGMMDRMPEKADPVTWSRQTEQFWKLPDPLIVGINAAQRLRLERRMRSQLKRAKPDLYHETDLIPPPLLDVPVVHTIHDLSLIKHRNMHPRERVWYFDLFFKRGIRHVDHIITVSWFIRDEIIGELGVAPERVTAIHEAPAPVFCRKPAQEIRSKLEQLNAPETYVLFVGTQEPRKNLGVIVQAMALMSDPPPLLLAGWSGWGERDWEVQIEKLGLGGRVRLTGYVDEEILACLYNGAAVVVYPSLYEGFGLPVLEAMACGCPVICSNAASLPEVGGDAALYIDPGDPEELAFVLDRILTDSELTASLRAKGLQRVEQFSWKRCALETLEVFRCVLARGWERR